MKKTSLMSAAALVMIIFAGCQQPQQKQTTEISRRDRLIGNENLELQNELNQCRSEIENQKRLIQQCRMDREKDVQQTDEAYKWLIEEDDKLREQCRQEKEKIIEDTNATAEWLAKELPQTLLNDNAKLTEEKDKLAARIAELEEILKRAGLKVPPPTPNEPNIPSPNEPPAN